MYDLSNSSIDNIIVHQVGNKSINESLTLSNEELVLPSLILDTLKSCFISSIKEKELCSFFHESKLTLNEMYNYSNSLFQDCNTSFVETSKNIAKHLFNQSRHPQIKGGELYVVYLSGCLLEGDKCDAIGLFKSEIKDNYIKVKKEKQGLNLYLDQGTNTNKVDKGCIIFNHSPEKGYVLSIVDSTNRAKGNEAKYWVNDFLNVTTRVDNYHATKDMVALCQDFIKNVLPQEYEVPKVDQAKLINRVISNLNAGSVDVDTLSKKVFEKEDAIQLFNSYRRTYENENNIRIQDNFEGSSEAIKKATYVKKISSIKLDNKYVINVLSEDDDNLEHGFDYEKGKRYYKIFFDQEK